MGVSFCQINCRCVVTLSDTNCNAHSTNHRNVISVSLSGQGRFVSCCFSFRPIAWQTEGWQIGCPLQEGWETESREYIEGVCNGLCPVLIGTGVTDLRLSQALGCYKWASLNFKRYRDQLKVTQILFNNILVGPAEKLLKTRVGTNMLQPHNPRLDWAFAEWLSLGREALSTS